MPFLDLLLGNTLTRLVFFPAVACLPLVFFKKGSDRAVKVYALAVSLIELALGAALICGHWGGGAGFPVVRDGGGPISWIPSFGITYDLVMDGISMPLVALTVLLLPLVILGTWRGVEATLRLRFTETAHGCRVRADGEVSGSGVWALAAGSAGLLAGRAIAADLGNAGRVMGGLDDR